MIDLNKYSDIETEAVFLGTVIFIKDAFIKVFDNLEPRDFYKTKHQHIFEAIVYCFVKNIGIDVISIEKAIRKLYPEDIPIAFELTQLNLRVVSDANIEYYVKIIKDLSKIRQFLILLKTHENIKETDNINNNILELQEQLLKINELEIDRDINFFNSIKKADKLLQEKLNGEKKVTGFKWSASCLTELTGGIEQPYIYVFGGLKKTGKSKFVIDQIHCLNQQNVPTLFLSLEMGESQVTRWIWSRFAEVDSMKIRYPVNEQNYRSLSVEDRYRLQKAKETIERLNDKLIVNTEPFLNFVKIKAKIFQAIQQIGIKVVFLDHLQRCNIENRKGQNEAKAIEEFVFRLADLAKENNIAFVLLSQIANIAEGKLATIKDLKHSGGIGEGTDFIGIMNRYSRIKQSDSNILRLDCWQRDGKSDTIYLHHDLTIGKFITGEKPENHKEPESTF